MELAQYKEQVQQSDVTLWGAAALIIGAVAVLSANLSGFLPASFVAGLHSTRMEGGSLNNIRSQVALLQAETIKIRNEYSRLATQMTLAEQGRGQVTRRVGALESTLPVILQAIPPGVGIDSSVFTSSFDGSSEATSFEAEGGSVTVSRTPLDPPTDQNGTIAPPQVEMPAILEGESTINTAPVATTSDFGIAIGPEITQLDAFVTWKDIISRVGTLLLGLEPILSEQQSNGSQRLIAGPVGNYAEAEQLCIRLLRVGISCLPTPYSGHAMPE